MFEETRDQDKTNVNLRDQPNHPGAGWAASYYFWGAARRTRDVIVGLFRRSALHVRNASLDEPPTLDPK